jgi:hypothetical protein
MKLVTTRLTLAVTLVLLFRSLGCGSTHTAPKASPATTQASPLAQVPSTQPQSPLPPQDPSPPQPAVKVDAPGLDLEAIRASVPEDLIAVGKEDLDTRIPRAFYFDYNYQPMPGKRIWTRVSDGKWTERYPDGTESSFVVLGRTKLADVTGTMVVKLSGDPSKTDTKNNGTFHSFIPDKQNAVKHFKYRNLDRANVQWSDLGEMKGIE